jgi:Ca2+-transporting ATPase
METEFGKIAGLIQEAGGDPTPLQRRLAELGRYLVVACLAISGLVVWAGVLRGEDLYNMVLAGVSLAVAAIPEGLPAVVTIVLALGVQRMIRRSVIIRKLPAVETLGCATVVCSDKTGTLTENEMTVRRLWTPADEYLATGQGFSLRGRIRPLRDGQEAPASALLERDPALRLLLVGGVLCLNARLDVAGGRSDSRVAVRGDPTEGALLVAGAKAGLARAAIEKRFPRTAEIPFSPDRRRMTTVHRWEGGRLVAFCKGAPDTVLGLCTHYQGERGPAPLTAAMRDRITAASDHMAASGLRVLGVAYRLLPQEKGVGSLDESALEQSLVLVGLAGMSDPPRPEVKGAIAVCRRAGVKVNMITGDHPATAVAIAGELDLLDPRLPVERQVITGRELDETPDRVLARRSAEIRVYARVSPGHKLRIVKALKARGEVVAMTGDGVNDAPAVREADIGVAMGQTGTEVTKEASDMVLTDDNFASIVAALEEGRVIYDNIRRFIRYLLSCNTGEVLTMMLGALFRLPLPLLPIQILWVNLVTDGLPAMALGLQAPEDDVSTRPPRSPREGIFARRLGVKIIGRGVIIGLSTVASFMLALHVTGWDLTVARTVAFGTLVVSQLVHAFDCRSERRALSDVPLSSNWYLVGATLVSFAMFLGVIYIPAAQPFFKTTPLGLMEWSWIIGASVWGQVAVGLRRVLIYQLTKRRAA